MMVLRVRNGRFLIFFIRFQQFDCFFDEENHPDNQPEPEFQAIVIAPEASMYASESIKDKGFRKKQAFPETREFIYLMEEGGVSG